MNLLDVDTIDLVRMKTKNDRSNGHFHGANEGDRTLYLRNHNPTL